jgi:hypothetical protein
LSQAFVWKYPDHALHIGYVRDKVRSRNVLKDLYKEQKMRTQINTFTNTFTNTVGENLEVVVNRLSTVVVDVNRKIADVAVSTADRLVDQLPMDLPFGDRFPTPAQSAETYIDFVERAVAVNRDFSERVIAMLKVDAPVVPVPTAAHPAAKKAAPRKAAPRKAAPAKARSSK